MRQAKDLDVRGKRVLVRSDLNVPVKDGVVGDDGRIRASVPLLRDLLDRGAMPVVVAHLGRPKGVHDPALSLAPVGERLQELLGEPSLYDEFLAHLAREGHAVPAALLDRDWSLPHRVDDDLVDVFARVYAAPHRHWGVYETCEELVDVEDAFQQWRFRHLQVVQRVIGHKVGTGGSSGVAFLRRALDLTFFPELYEVRTRIGG